MVNVFTLGWWVLASWVVSASGLWTGGGRACCASWRAVPRLNNVAPHQARSTTSLAVSPLESGPPVSSTQSQISAVEGRIANVEAQIVEVVESVKAVQSQVVDVGAKIEITKIALKQAQLLPDDKTIPVSYTHLTLPTTPYV